MISIDLKGISKFVPQATLDEYTKKAENGLDTVLGGKGAGNDFLGWVNLPSEIDENTINSCNSIADKWKGFVDVVVMVGIGGSYLGAKAVIEALGHAFNLSKKEGCPQILYAGNNISEDYAAELLDYLSMRKFAIVVISKSGTTTEPAIAFRLLKNDLEKRFGKRAAKERIVAITDKSKGALHTLATQEGYETFVIPDNVGGRFSVLTPVGLLPIAIAGFDIKALVEGACEMQKNCAVKAAGNPAIEYAAARNAVHAQKKDVEILVNFNPKLQYFGEWWKQLYGESEGKDGKGIFPASVNFTTDLHSMGQFIQDGTRMMFETSVLVDNAKNEVKIEEDLQNLDGLNFLAGKRVEEINKMAQIGTRLAHIDGGVPNIEVHIEKLDEQNLGELIYFFEIACGISGYMLGVNPFNQPGVEAYKKNMFALLNKPGYEKESEEIKKRL
ncbi:MAG: glucose-6-phosphate isomerase [Bacteroidales bacterium]|jgi:glucose-6-phosphate isomerase|nr:glucose-6-phosphate isomerase [Bacteroidales bacterium]